MARAEFSRRTKRAAYERSGGLCEATGSMYGLREGVRCLHDLAYGVEFDHHILDANSRDNSLENCRAVCLNCHRYKTAKHDIPLAAKTQRQQDKHRGIKGRKYKWPKRKMQSRKSVLQSLPDKSTDREP